MKVRNLLLAVGLGLGTLAAQTASLPKIFLANEGGSDNTASDRAFDSLKQAITSSGNYELVASPAKADAVFVLQLEDKDFVSGGRSYPDHFVKLSIRETKSQQALWSVTEHGPVNGFTHHWTKDFDKVSAKLLDDLKKAQAKGQFTMPSTTPDH